MEILVHRRRVRAKYRWKDRISAHMKQNGSHARDCENRSSWKGSWKSEETKKKKKKNSLTSIHHIRNKNRQEKLKEDEM